MFLKLDLKEDLKSQLVGNFLYNSESKSSLDSLGDNIKFVNEDDLPKKKRVIKPGYMVTMDYDPERLNVHIRDDFYIKDVKWG